MTIALQWSSAGALRQCRWRASRTHGGESRPRPCQRRWCRPHASNPSGKECRWEVEGRRPKPGEKRHYSPSDAKRNTPPTKSTQALRSNVIDAPPFRRRRLLNLHDHIRITQYHVARRHGSKTPKNCFCGLHNMSGLNLGLRGPPRVPGRLSAHWEALQVDDVFANNSLDDIRSGNSNIAP